MPTGGHHSRFTKLGYQEVEVKCSAYDHLAPSSTQAPITPKKKSVPSHSSPTQVGEAMDRQGTFQFMAVAILDNPFIQQAILHDLESFVWVLTHTSLLYASSRLEPKARGDQLVLFDYFPSAPSSNIKSLIYLQELFAEDLQLQSKPLTLLIESLLAVVRDSYRNSSAWDKLRLAAIKDATDVASEIDYLPKNLSSDEVERMNKGRVEHVNKTLAERRMRLSNHDWFITTLKSFLDDEEWKAQQDHWVANEIEMHLNPKAVIQGVCKGELRSRKDVSVNRVGQM